MRKDFFGTALRRRIVFLIIVGMISLQTLQLINMQLLQGAKYEKKSNRNSIKSFSVKAPRGIIFDRNIEILVGNKPSFTVEILPSEYDKKNSRIIEKVFGVKEGYISKILEKYKRYSKFKPRTIFRGVDFNKVSWIEENHEKLPGIRFSVVTKRDYSFGINGSHIFGYTKEIDRETLNKNKDIYSIGDNVGFNGLEKSYEKYLRGKKGKEYFVVDSRQRIVSKYNQGKSDVAPVKGNDLVTTLDYETQKKAEELFSNKKGAVVAIEPASGEIIAYVSAPQYNLADFADFTSTTLWDSLRSDEAKPLFNRGTISMYPPGSTYKILLAVAALDEGVVSSSYKVDCKGGMQFGNRFFKCTHYHGKIDMQGAIEKSCNTYFYNLILKLGIDNLSEYSQKFHLGEKTGIDISPESKGLIPSKNYYDKIYGKGRWTKGYLLNLGIGQGEIITTPIQLAQYTSLLANWGATVKPHFAKGYIDSYSNEFIPFSFDSVKADVSINALKVVRKAMRYVVGKEEGTAHNIELPNIKISGKTGTAQNPHGDDHSIFIAFAPYDNPKIAVAVIVENAGYGSSYAAPIAQKIIEAYLTKERKITFDNLKDK